MLESCSNPQRLGKSLSLHWKKIIGYGFHVFVSDVITKVDLWSFWIRLAGPEPIRLHGSIYISY